MTCTLCLYSFLFYFQPWPPVWNFILKDSFVWMSLQLHIAWLLESSSDFTKDPYSHPPVALDITLLHFNGCSEMGPSCFPVSTHWLFWGFPVLRSVRHPVSLGFLLYRSCYHTALVTVGVYFHPFVFSGPWRDLAICLTGKCYPWVFGFAI